MPTIAEAQHRCDIEETQRRFVQEPRPTAEIERLLAECETSGSPDYRVPMLRGVIARGAGDRDQAISYLRKAHEMAPQEPNPALELGFTLEALRPEEARKVYEQILARDPASRPALLGLARVARAQNRLQEARAIYGRLLVANPSDLDSLNGMAWLELANRRRDQARAGFEHVLDIAPENEEARTGLLKSPNVYRYTVEANGTAVSTDQGTSREFQARATAGITAFDTLELGWRHFSNPLLTVSERGISEQPSEDITVGYHRVVPLDYAVSLVYDHRDHGESPTEHWIDGSITVFLSDRLIWFGGYRQSFGDVQYNGRLIRTGITANIASNWQVTTTIYNSQAAAFHDYRSLWSGVVDLTHTGPRNMLLVAGVGASPAINNVNLHARAILPATDRIALQLIGVHDSVNSATSMTGGLLVTW